MATTEAIHTGEAVLYLYPHEHCVETVTIKSGEDLPACAVVGKISATGKYVAYANSANDGSEAAAGVLLYATDASSADTLAVVVVRGPAGFKADGLDWGGNDGTGVTAGIADLLALGIKVRS